MAKKANRTDQQADTLFGPATHIRSLIEWMSQGVYEKEHIIAAALLCAVAGENIFLLGPPGTAKSMVASRLKMIFRDGKSFDYLMSRFSTPDEIFGPISISKLKTEDKYERLTEGYLPDVDIVFLDEIWKAGPSIQNTLLTVINEHIFHNGGKIIKTPMKVLIAASNELPAKDEGLEALWDRFLVRMVSNCIESDTSFFKMLKSPALPLKPLSEDLYLTEEIYLNWQEQATSIELSKEVMDAIKSIRKSLAKLEKDDENKLRYYISDRRWRKAFHLMQTSAFLNGRKVIMLSDYMLMIHCLWNDVECIPEILKLVPESIAEPTIKRLDRIDKAIRQIMQPSQQKPKEEERNKTPHLATEFVEYDFFYYLVENYPEGETYFSKWDYATLEASPTQGIRYYDTKRKKNIVHVMIKGAPFENKLPNAGKLTKVSLQKCEGGIIIDSIPYTFRRKFEQAESTLNAAVTPVLGRIYQIQKEFRDCVSQWQESTASNWQGKDNIFLSDSDYALADRMLTETEEKIKVLEIKINNLSMFLK